ncbi:E3 ubiquitin-protein ligase BRE1-like [Tribolium madens]|uniref:E3 ubiquitin-protein ligase BRE1-like n=1 Tax=Tribolium madens TaxID=41895 RepID=UPI001CF74BA8|nr:E3 ubiquitin-protein ligase BRE1-like [Tribolium madens]
MSGTKISDKDQINPSSAEKIVSALNVKSTEAFFADPLVTEAISNISTPSAASGGSPQDLHKERPSVTIDTSGDSLNKSSADHMSHSTVHSNTTQASQETINTGSTVTSTTSVETTEGAEKSLQSILSKKSISQTTLNTISQASSLGTQLSDVTMDSGRRSRASQKRLSNVFRRPSAPTSNMSFRNPLDDMTNAELVSAVTELEKSAKHLELENMVFLHFLEKNEPSLIEGMDNVLKTVQTMQDRTSVSSKRLTLTRASRQSEFLSYSTSSITPMTLEKEGPRINITQKTDLIMREMDDIQAALDKINRKCYITRHKLKAELEEMAIRESEIQEIKDTFERIFINNEVLEKYTQKNPADRFCRFMDETFKKTRATTDKLRLRTSSLKVQYQKICAQLTQKKLLGEHLQEVDFEQLEIENKHLREKIDKRNLLLLELKKMNGHANLLLSNQKKHLLKKVTDLKVYQDTIKTQEELVRKIDDECEKVSEELDATKEEYDKIKTKSENYEVPSVLEYVKKKAELGLLKKNLKIWERRKQIKDMALTASVREMKHATGLPTVKSSWFINPHDLHRGRGSIESTFEFIFERKMRLSQLLLHKKRSSRRKTQ